MALLPTNKKKCQKDKTKRIKLCVISRGKTALPKFTLSHQHSECLFFLSVVASSPPDCLPSLLFSVKETLAQIYLRSPPHGCPAPELRRRSTFMLSLAPVRCPRCTQRYFERSVWPTVLLFLRDCGRGGYGQAVWPIKNQHKFVKQTFTVCLKCASAMLRGGV